MREELTKVARHTLVYGFGKVFGKAVSFLLIPFYTYYLTPADYGVLEILNLTSMIVALLIAMGIPSSVMRFYYDTNDPEERRTIVSTGVLFSYLLASVVGGLSLLFAKPIARELLGSESFTRLVQLVAASFFFTACSDVSYSYLRAKQRSGLYAILNQLSLVISLSLNVYLVAFRHMGVVGVFWGTLAASFVLWIVLLLLTLPEVGFRFSLKRLRPMLVFGTPLLMASTSSFVLNYADRFFLQRFTSLADVGLYSLAYKFGFMVSLLAVQPFSLMWEVQAYEIATQANAKQVFARLFSLYAGALLAISTVISMFIPEVFRLVVNAKFHAAYPVVPLIAFAYAAEGMGIFMTAGLLIQKRSPTIAKIALACTGVALLLKGLLIYRWTMWGAAVATLLGFAFTAAVIYRFSRRIYQVAYDVKPVLFVALIGGICVTAGWILPVSSWWIKLGLKAVLILAFFVLLVLQVVRTSELSSLRQSLIGVWFGEHAVPAMAAAGVTRETEVHSVVPVAAGSEDE